jgi:hypothetical protein
MLDDDEGRTAVGAHCVEEQFERLKAAGRSAYRDDTDRSARSFRACGVARGIVFRRRGIV